MTIPSDLNYAPGPQAADLLRRLRAWSFSSWRHGSRIDVTRSALQELAALASAADGRRRPSVPDAGVHSLADQLQVLTVDAIGAGAAHHEVERVLADLARRLGLPTARRRDNGLDSGRT